MHRVVGYYNCRGTGRISYTRKTDKASGTLKCSLLFISEIKEGEKVKQQQSADVMKIKWKKRRGEKR